MSYARCSECSDVWDEGALDRGGRCRFCRDGVARPSPQSDSERRVHGVSEEELARSYEIDLSRIRR